MIVILGLIALCFGQTFPGVQSLQGTVAEYRVLTKSAVQGVGTFNPLNGGAAIAFNGAVQVSVVVNGVEGPATTLSQLASYVPVRIPLGNSAELFFNASGANLLCRTSLSATSPLSRKTFVFAQTSQQIQQSCSLSTGTPTGSCLISAAGLQTFTCGEQNSETPDTRTCDSVKLDVRRFDALTCPLRLTRTLPAVAGVDSATEKVFLSKQFTIASDSTTLKRANTYAFDASGATAFQGDIRTRSIEAIVTDSTTTVTKLTTGFVKFLNAAHRETLSGNLDSCDIAIRDPRISTGNGYVAYIENVAAGQQSPADFIELPFANNQQYIVEVYSGEMTSQNVLSGVAPVAGVNTAVATLTLTASNFFQVVVISTQSGGSFTNVQLRAVDVSPSTSAVAVGTNSVVWNETPVSLKLQIVDNDFCSTNTAIASQASQTVNSVALQAAAGSRRTFRVVDDASTCASPSASFKDLQLADGAANTCTLRHVFMLGRNFQFNDTTLSQGCSGTFTCAVTRNRMGDLSFLGTGVKQSSSQGELSFQTITVPVCNCGVASTTCVAATCDEIKANMALTSDISEKVNALSSIVPTQLRNVNATVVATRGTVNTINENVKALAKDMKDVPDDVSDLKKDVSDISDDLSSVQDDVEKVKDNVKSLLPKN